MKYGDEIQPISSYADDKERKYIFMSWMGNDLKGYARVATIQLNGDGFDEQGVWKERIGLVLQGDTMVHSSKIRKQLEL